MRAKRRLAPPLLDLGAERFDLVETAEQKEGEEQISPELGILGDTQAAPRQIQARLVVSHAHRVRRSGHERLDVRIRRALGMKRNRPEREGRLMLGSQERQPRLVELPTHGLGRDFVGALRDGIVRGAVRDDVRFGERPPSIGRQRGEVRANVGNGWLGARLDRDSDFFGRRPTKEDGDEFAIERLGLVQVHEGDTRSGLAGARRKVDQKIHEPVGQSTRKKTGIAFARKLERAYDVRRDGDEVGDFRRDRQQRQHMALDQVRSALAGVGDDRAHELSGARVRAAMVAVAIHPEHDPLPARVPGSAQDWLMQTPVSVLGSGAAPGTPGIAGIMPPTTPSRLSGPSSRDSVLASSFVFGGCTPSLRFSSDMVALLARAGPEAPTHDRTTLLLLRPPDQVRPSAFFATTSLRDRHIGIGAAFSPCRR
jgi:hypothetical protein